jgi:hypothetical protein
MEITGANGHVREDDRGERIAEVINVCVIRQSPARLSAGETDAREKRV